MIGLTRILDRALDPLLVRTPRPGLLIEGSGVDSPAELVFVGGFNPVLEPVGFALESLDRLVMELPLVDVALAERLLDQSY